MQATAPGFVNRSLRLCWHLVPAPEESAAGMRTHLRLHHYRGGAEPGQIPDVLVVLWGVLLPDPNPCSRRMVTAAVRLHEHVRARRGSRLDQIHLPDRGKGCRSRLALARLPGARRLRQRRKAQTSERGFDLVAVLVFTPSGKPPKDRQENGDDCSVEQPSPVLINPLQQLRRPLFSSQARDHGHRDMKGGARAGMERRPSMLAASGSGSGSTAGTLTSYSSQTRPQPE